MKSKLLKNVGTGVVASVGVYIAVLLLYYGVSGNWTGPKEGDEKRVRNAARETSYSLNNLRASDFVQLTQANEVATEGPDVISAFDGEEYKIVPMPQSAKLTDTQYNLQTFKIEAYDSGAGFKDGFQFAFPSSLAYSDDPRFDSISLNGEIDIYAVNSDGDIKYLSTLSEDRGSPTYTITKDDIKNNKLPYAESNGTYYLSGALIFDITSDAPFYLTYCENYSEFGGDPVIIDQIVSRKRSYTGVNFGGSKDISIDILHPLTEAQILDQIKAQDSFGNDADISVSSSNYDPTKVGEYVIELVATPKNNAENITTLTLNIKVINKKPIITSTASDNNEFTFAFSKVTGWNDILKHYTATDYYGNQIPVFVKENSGLTFDRVGTFHPVLAAVDDEGNETTINAKVTINDDLKVVFYFTDKMAEASATSPLKADQIQQVILNGLKIKKSEVRQFKIVENSYSINADTIGNYEISYVIDLVNGQSRAGVMKIEVSDRQLDARSRTAGERIKEFFTKLWNFITFRGFKL